MVAFRHDVKIGRKGEEIAREVMSRGGLVCEPNQSTKKDEMSGWDFRFNLDGKLIYVEVKHDIYEAKSGNVAVEFFNPRISKQSGILATTSDLWVFVLADNSVWVCNTNRLKEHFLSNLGFVRDIQAGGDGNADMRLYRRETLFDKMFYRLDDLYDDDINSEIDMVLTDNRIEV